MQKGSLKKKKRQKARKKAKHILKLYRNMHYEEVSKCMRNGLPEGTMVMVFNNLPGGENVRQKFLYLVMERHGIKNAIQNK